MLGVGIVLAEPPARRQTETLFRELLATRACLLVLREPSCLLRDPSDTVSVQRTNNGAGLCLTFASSPALRLARLANRSLPEPERIQLASCMSLANIHLRECALVLLEGNLFLTASGAQITIRLDSCTDVVLSNQRFASLRVSLAEGSSLYMQNVVCDELQVTFSGSSASRLYGANVRSTLVVWSATPDCRVLDTLLESDARVIHRVDGLHRVEVSSLSARPTRARIAPSFHSPYLSNVFPNVTYHCTADQAHQQRRELSASLACSPRPAVTLLDEPRCTLCLENYANSIAECGHRAFCVPCLQRPERNSVVYCPLCRVKITGLAALPTPPHPLPLYAARSRPSSCKSGGDSSNGQVTTGALNHHHHHLLASTSFLHHHHSTRPLLAPLVVAAPSLSS